MDATSSNKSNSSSNSSSNLETITKVVGELVIDGHGGDKTWEALEWRTLDNYWLGEVPAAEDFSGKYKLSWNEDYIYVLAEIQDDILIDTHEDGLDRYWDDDCLELFIDEDNSGGNHQYNHSAYAYHIATNLRVADIGTDSIPIYLDHHLRSAKVTSGTTTTWEVAVRIMNDNPTVKGKARKLKAGEEIGFMIAYCDNDASIEREHFIGSIPVEGEDKNRGWIDAGIFNDWLLTE
jgi:hypothetical protein